MSTAPAIGFEYGRATASSAMVTVVERDLSNPAVVQAIVDEATKVARAEQTKRRRSVGFSIRPR